MVNDIDEEMASWRAEIANVRRAAKALPDTDERKATLLTNLDAEERSWTVWRRALYLQNKLPI
jgi:hypothetical protein